MSAGWRGGIARGLLHPVPLFAMALLVVNDHWMKEAWAHPLTGKLSDFAGLAFFPLLLVALAEVVQGVVGRFGGPSDRCLVAAVVATAVVFTLVQTTSPATEMYRLGLGALQHPDSALAVIASGGSLEALPRVAATPDATDLVALPALLLAACVGRAKARDPDSTRERPAARLTGPQPVH